MYPREGDVSHKWLTDDSRVVSKNELIITIIVIMIIIVMMMMIYLLENYF